VLPLIRDGGSDFALAYAAGGDSVFVVRPDGYLGFTGLDGDIDALVAHLRATFGSLR
jgi:pentachlorophenol monooxygenase